MGTAYWFYSNNRSLFSFVPLCHAKCYQKKKKIINLKKLYLYVFLGLMWCNVGFAECIEGDCINGHGTFTYVSGDKYIGEHKDGKEHGQGTYTWSDGRKYVGEHKDGKRHGQGTYTWVSGDKYIGGWKENKEHGQGTYTWASGHKYVGEYKDGKRHGQGTFTATDGRVTRGIWENGELVEPN